MRRRLDRGTRARLSLIAIAAIALAACSSAAILPTAAGAPDSGSSSSDAYSGSGGEPVLLPAASAAPSVAAAAPDANTGSGGTLAVLDNNLQIVYTGSLQLVVTDVQQALAKAKTAVAAAGGYIGASQANSSGDQPTATITYRIPAARWDDTIGALEAIGTKVVSEQTQAADVGGQLVDLQARLANLRASETALQNIATNTAKVSDLLEVQAQLTDVRGQIEELDAQRARLADQVAYGTLVTTFGTEVQAVQVAAKGWDPASDVDGATAALLGFGQHIVSGAIWFVIVWVPFLLVAGIALFVVWRLLRRFGPKRMVPVDAGPTWSNPDPTAPDA